MLLCSFRVIYVPTIIEGGADFMILNFNVKGAERKKMVVAIEEAIGKKAKYLRAPSFAYEIGNFTIGKNGELEFGDFDD